MKDFRVLYAYESSRGHFMREKHVYANDELHAANKVRKILKVPICIFDVVKGTY